ncbi:MAG: hypothetical protein ACKORF_03895 [Micrococcales bacterium]
MSYHQNPEEAHLWEQIEGGSQREQAEAFGRLAELSVNRENFDNAVIYGERSASLFKGINDAFGEAEGLYQQGRGYLGQKQAKEAILKFDEAAEIFRANANELFLAASVSRKADALVILEQQSLAAAAYENAAVLYANCGNHSSAGETYLRCATALIDAREFAAAELKADQARLSFIEADELQGVARSLHLRSVALGFQHNLDAAVADIREAIELAKYLEFEPFDAMCHLQLASLLVACADVAGATDALAVARKQANEVKDYATLAQCDLHEAYLYFNLDAFDRARAHATTARAAFNAQNDKVSVFETDVLMGRILLGMDQPLESIEVLEKAIAFANQHQVTIYEERCYIALADALLRVQNASYALETLEKIQFPGELAENMAFLARTLRARALIYLERHQEAQELAEQIISETSQMAPNFFAGIDAQETIARSLIMQGNLDLALPALQLAIVRHSAHGSDEVATELSRRWLELTQSKVEPSQPEN